MQLLRYWDVANTDAFVVHCHYTSVLVVECDLMPLQMQVYLALSSHPMDFFFNVTLIFCLVKPKQTCG